MRHLDKKSDSKNKTELPENASPVCYLESPDLRPEYRIDKETSNRKTTNSNPEK